MSDVFSGADRGCVTSTCAKIAQYIGEAEAHFGEPAAVTAMSKALVEFNMLLVRLSHIQENDNLTSAPNVGHIKQSLAVLKESLLEASKDGSWFPDMDEYSDWIEKSLEDINTQVKEANDPDDVEKLKQSLVQFKQAMPEPWAYDIVSRSKRNMNVLNPINERLTKIAYDVSIMLAYTGGKE